MKRNTFFALFLSGFALAGAFALDFGAVISGEFGVERDGVETRPGGKTLLAPWLSLAFDNADFYLSLGVNTDYSEKVPLAPELLQLDFSARFFPWLFVRAGRIPWQDPSGFIVRGRLDGADVLFDFGNLRIGAAAFYTGFLFKDTADINYSPGDREYDDDFSWDNFAYTYFAPRRLLAALYGEFPGLPFGRGRLYAGVLAQFDFSDVDEKFHTQYLFLRHTLDYRNFDISAAGAAELENTGAGGLRAAYAFSVEGGWQFSGAFKNRVSLGARWASGEGPKTAAFFPLIREAQGLVFKPHFSGIMTIRANWEMRFLPSLSGALGGRYFFRTDGSSFVDPDIVKASYALGLETAASLLWVPLSDISFSLEGGVFLPQTGTAMRDDAPVRWVVTLGTIFSF